MLGALPRHNAGQSIVSNGPTTYHAANSTTLAGIVKRLVASSAANFKPA